MNKINLSKEGYTGKIPKTVMIKIKKMVKKHPIILTFLGSLTFMNAPIFDNQSIIAASANYQIAKENKEVIDNYKQIVNNTTNFINELGIDNSDDIYSLITLLIKSGFFSIDGSFYYDNELPTWDIKGYEGIDIFKGYGCCRHEPEILNRILNNCGYESYTVVNYSYNNTQDPTFYQKGNHVVVFTKYQDGFKVYDPTNFMIGTSHDKTTIDFNSQIKIDVKLLESYITGYTDFKGIWSLLKLYQDNKVILGDNKLSNIDEHQFGYLYVKYRNLNLENIKKICEIQGYEYEWNSISK